MADDRDARLLLILSGEKGAPLGRGDAERAEQRRRDLGRIDLFRLASARQFCGRGAIRANCREGPLIPDEVEIIGRRYVESFDARRRDRPVTSMSRSGSAKPGGRINAAFTSVKTALFAPIPNARVRMVTRVNAGALTSARRP